MNELHNYLTQPNYQKNIIQSGIAKSKSIPKQQLRTIKPKPSNTNLIPFVTTHDPGNPNITTIAKANIYLLNTSPVLKDLITKTNIIKSKRQPETIKDILTRACFTEKETPSTVSICHDKRCGTGT